MSNTVSENELGSRLERLFYGIHSQNGARQSYPGTAFVEGCVATIIAALVYFSLQGELPYHDAERFIGQVLSAKPVWDVAHILLQPTALALQHVTHADPLFVLKDLSCTAAAAAVGLFYIVLVRLGLPRWKCCVGTLLVAGSCSVLTLAPSAHPKLVAFPFINGALLCLLESERGRGGQRTLLLGGVLLAIGGGFLASALATVPFAAVAIFVQSRRRGGGMREAALFVGACAVTFIFIVAAAHFLITGNGVTLQSLTSSVADKASLRIPSSSVAVQLARTAFGTVNNLVTIPGVGATLQAWLKGQIPSLWPYRDLLPGFATWLLSAVVLSAVYFRAAMFVISTRTLPIAIAFLCGAQCWSIWYGLNDPEHWFQLLVPTVILFLTLLPDMLVRWVFPTWTMLILTINFALMAGPVSAYPLAREQAALDRMLTASDRIVMFSAYPGRPYLGFFGLSEERTERVDRMLLVPATSVQATLERVDADIVQTLQRGGRVIVADMLDDRDWEAPWLALLGAGVTKDHLVATLLHGRDAERLRDLGGIKLWELRETRQGAPMPQAAQANTD